MSVTDTESTEDSSYPPFINKFDICNKMFKDLEINCKLNNIYNYFYSREITRKSTKKVSS